jgi:hypothetical protein
LPDEASLATTKQAVPEYDPSTEVPSTGDEPETTEVADKDDMETAEIIVFRPLFSYRRVQAERRRRLNQARNQRVYYQNYPYYPYGQ